MGTELGGKQKVRGGKSAAKRSTMERSVLTGSPPQTYRSPSTRRWNTRTRTHTHSEYLSASVDSRNRERWRLRKWVEDEGGRGGENEKKGGVEGVVSDDRTSRTSYPGLRLLSVCVSTWVLLWATGVR